LRDYLGEATFLKIKMEFLVCLSDEKRESDTTVKFIVVIDQSPAFDIFVTIYPDSWGRIKVSLYYFLYRFASLRTRRQL